MALENHSAENRGNGTERNCSGQDQGVITMGNATRGRGASFAARTNVAASRPPITNVVAAEGFQAAVFEFPAADLARAAHRTKNAAKGWKDGSRAPDIASAINMARALPCVQEWLIHEIGAGARDAQAMSADAVIRWAREARNAAGMDGDIARAILREVSGIEPEPKPRVVNETIVLDNWKFLDKKEERAFREEWEKSNPPKPCKITEDFFERRRA